MNPSTIREFASTLANDLRPTAQVLSLVRAEGRRPRREPVSSTGPFGQILLFTGVRYERMPDFEVESAETEPAAQRRHS